MTHWILGLLEFAHAVSSPQMLIVRKDLIAAATETSEPATEEQYSFLTESRTSPMKSMGSVLEQSSEAQRVGGTKTSIQCQTERETDKLADEHADTRSQAHVEAISVRKPSNKSRKIDAFAAETHEIIQQLVVDRNSKENEFTRVVQE